MCAELWDFCAHCALESIVKSCLIRLLQHNITPLHSAINASHTSCLALMLTLPNKQTNKATGADQDSQAQHNLVNDVINMVDKDGWTLAHLAASRDSKVGKAIHMQFNPLLILWNMITILLCHISGFYGRIVWRL